jgi:Putative zinc- or iron-chelating domain
VPQPDPLRELERQVERGSLFAHAALSEQANRFNDGYALVNGLVELLIQNKLVDADELLKAVKSVRGQIADAGQAAELDVVVRVDAEDPTPGPPVDCEARLPYCKAVCCRLRFPLNVEEIESGRMKWDLGRPYFNRHGGDGYCLHCDGETRACGVYEQRPTPCRQYSCAGDTRIWKDFDAMVINQEWIDATLGQGPGPIEIFMSTADPAKG